jgi:cytochrome c biogenesis protein CcdA
LTTLVLIGLVGGLITGISPCVVGATDKIGLATVYLTVAFAVGTAIPLLALGAHQKAALASRAQNPTLTLQNSVGL